MANAQRTKRLSLNKAQRDLLWMIAQHKYGWVYCPNVGSSERRLQTAQALERRGLVTIDRSGSCPTCSPTEAGKAEIKRCWPDSPFVLGTYDRPPYGWTPRDGDQPFFPSTPCIHCGKFVGRFDGYFNVEYFEMSSTIASMDAEHRDCAARVEAERRERLAA